MDVLSFGRVHDQTLVTCARNVWLMTAVHNISMTICCTEESHNNAADLLSRWKNAPEDILKMNQLVDSPIWINTHFDLTLLNYDF